MLINLLTPIFIFALGFLLVASIKIGKKDKRYLNLLWIYHLLFSIFYYFYVLYKGGDAFGYWANAKEMTSADFMDSFSGSQGTEFMVALNYIPANLIGMNFFTNSLFFGLLGFIAFTFLYRICLQTIPYNSKFFKFRLFPLLFFLPNLHFWSSGVGKDTMLFLCISIVAYGFMRISKRFPLVLIGLLLSYGIRPHVTLILLVSFGFVYVINGKISVLQRIFLVICLSVVAGLILPSVLEFTKMDELSIEDFEEFSDSLATGLSEAGSSTDLSSYPYPLKVLTFLYRPFFFDSNGIPAVVASFENLLLLLLSIRVIRSRFFATFKAAPFVIQGLFLFFIMGALVFSMSMSNLGIILRQRNMFLPGLILFILWSFSYTTKQKLISKKRGNG